MKENFLHDHAIEIEDDRMKSDEGKLPKSEGHRHSARHSQESEDGHDRGLRDESRSGSRGESADSSAADLKAGSHELEAGEAPVPQADYERLQGERDRLLDQLARLQAEFDNYRKREARERNEYREYATANAVERFLPVLDNFQLALASQGTTEQLRSGVGLIVRQMEDILRTLGVQPVPAVETQFDPRLHEAIEMVSRDDVPDHQVLDEVRRGYTLRGRLLRPAMVRVAHNPKQKSE